MDFFKTGKGKITIAAAIVIIIAAIVLMFVLMPGGEAAYRTISVSEISGEVKVENDGKIYDAYPEMSLSDGYALSTGTESYTRMELDGDKYVKLEEKSRALFEKLGKKGDGHTVIRLDKGAITNEITKPLSDDESYVVNTPNAVLAVRGTFFRIQVMVDENGDYYTDVFTYGGSVECKRILPDGTVVNESVTVDAGFKTRIKMDTSETIYLVEEVDDNGQVINTTPIVISEDISDDDLVDILDAAQNGHEMFISIEEIEAIIRERNIDLSNYRSKYDGSRITISDSDSTTAATTSEAATGSETTTTASTTTEAVSSEETTAAVTTTSSEATTTAVTTTTAGTTAVITHASTTTTVVTASSGEITTSDADEISDTADETTTTTATSEEITTTTTGATTTPGYIIITSGSITTSGTTPVTTTPVLTTTPVETTEHECVFEEYIYNEDATCTEDGTKTAVCSCGEIDVITAEGTALGHTEATETVAPTFYEGGLIRTYCTVCNQTISEEIIDKLAPLDMSSGHILITETGYITEDGTENEYTGDYLITQSDASSSFSLTIGDGEHNIEFENVSLTFTDTAPVYVSEGSTAVFSGELSISSGEYNSGVYALDNSGTVEFASGTFEFTNGETAVYNTGTITLTDGTLAVTGNSNYSFYNKGTFTINGGTFESVGSFENSGGDITLNDGVFTATGSSRVLQNYSGTLTVNGGTLTVSSAEYGIYTYSTIYINGGTVKSHGTYSGISIDSGNIVLTGGNVETNRFSNYSGFVITGGSLKASNGYSGDPTNGDSEVYCSMFESMPSVSERTFTKSDGSSYVYALTEEDRNEDGYFYIWIPSDHDHNTVRYSAVANSTMKETCSTCGTLLSALKITSNGSNYTGSVVKVIAEGNMNADDIVYCCSGGCVDAGIHTASFTKGGITITKVFGIYDSVPQKNAQNYYEIYTASDLYWFAELVNGTLDGVAKNSSANAVLMADIDLSGNVWTPIGELAYDYQDKAGYSGIFDGNNKVISGINFAAPSSPMAYGLFGGLASGTVKNLGIDGFTFSDGTYDHRVGAVAGVAFSGSSITDCYAVNVSIDAGEYICGGLVGANSGDIENCLTYNLTLTGSAGHTGGICGDHSAGTIVNCYTDYADVTGTAVTGGTVDAKSGTKTAAQFSGGEVAYLLNGSSSEGSPVWLQLIGTDSYPSFEGSVVYYNNGAYTN